jgi:hypothetical protein
MYNSNVQSFIFLLLISLPVFADINFDTHKLTFEYGTSFHTIRGHQQSNDSKGKLTSPQMPYVNASYMFTLSNVWGVDLFGGMQFVRFSEPPGTFSLKSEDQVLSHFGIELQKKLGSFARLGFFGRHQDHPLYVAKTPTEIEVLRKTFVEAGVHYSLSQRRRIGLLWGVGVKAFLLFPTDGGNVTTESGAGAEGYARLGWVGPFGTQIQVKGFYQNAQAPNADIHFEHENLGYSGVISYSY